MFFPLSTNIWASYFADSLLDAAGERRTYTAMAVSSDFFGSGTHEQRVDFLNTQMRWVSSRPTFYNAI